MPKVKKIYVALAHDIFGNMGEDQKMETYNYIGYNITRGSMHSCKTYSTGKLKQKNITKASENFPAMKSNKRVFFVYFDDERTK